MQSPSASTVILRFFTTALGELSCRATDARTLESWMVPAAKPLWHMLRDLSQDTLAERTTR
jgi:hypothetical protein